MHTCAIDTRRRLLLGRWRGSRQTRRGATGRCASWQKLGWPAKVLVRRRRAPHRAVDDDGGGVRRVHRRGSLLEHAPRHSLDPGPRDPAVRTSRRSAACAALALRHGKISCSPTGGSALARQPPAAPVACNELFVPAKVALGESYVRHVDLGDARCWLRSSTIWKRPVDKCIQWPGELATRTIAVGDRRFAPSMRAAPSTVSSPKKAACLTKPRRARGDDRARRASDRGIDDVVDVGPAPAATCSATARCALLKSSRRAGATRVGRIGTATTRPRRPRARVVACRLIKAQLN
jgi:hypothetical protein